MAKTLAHVPVQMLLKLTKAYSATVWTGNSLAINDKYTKHLA